MRKKKITKIVLCSLLSFGMLSMTGCTDNTLPESASSSVEVKTKISTIANTTKEKVSKEKNEAKTSASKKTDEVNTDTNKKTEPTQSEKTQTTEPVVSKSTTVEQAKPVDKAPAESTPAASSPVSTSSKPASTPSSEPSKPTNMKCETVTIEHPAKTHTVEHPAQTGIVKHPAEYDYVYHYYVVCNGINCGQKFKECYELGAHADALDARGWALYNELQETMDDPLNDPTVYELLSHGGYHTSTEVEEIIVSEEWEETVVEKEAWVETVVDETAWVEMKTVCE